MRKNKNNNQKNNNNKHQKNNNNNGQSQQQQQHPTNNNPNFKKNHRNSGQNQINNTNNISINNNITNTNLSKHYSKKQSGLNFDQNINNFIEEIGDKNKDNINNIVRRRHKTLESGDGDKIAIKKGHSTINGMMASMKSLNPKILHRNLRERERERAERGQLVLWRRPLLTITYCSLEIMELTRVLGRK